MNNDYTTSEEIRSILAAGVPQKEKWCAGTLKLGTIYGGKWKLVFTSVSRNEVKLQDVSNLNQWWIGTSQEFAETFGA